MEEKTYVKMCDCPEIQGHREKFEDGDVLANYRKEWKETEKDTQKAKLIFDGVLIFHDGISDVKDRNLIIWLPRQDDIQKMFKGHECGLEIPFALAGKFSDEMENFITGDPSWWTMEGLWLAFYMWKKHGKTWDGKEWVAELTHGDLTK